MKGLECLSSPNKVCKNKSFRFEIINCVAKKRIEHICNDLRVSSSCWMYGKSFWCIFLLAGVDLL